MSLEELQADFKANAETIKKLDAFTSVSDIVNLLKFTIWPFQENVIKEMSEIDAAVQDMVDGIDDVLCESTAGVIAAPIIAAKAIIAQFKAALPATATDQLLAIKRWEKMAKDAEEAIAEIVVMDEDEPVEEPDEPDEDADDDGDDDEDEDTSKAGK